MRTSGLGMIIIASVLSGCNSTSLVDVDGEKWGAEIPELEVVKVYKRSNVASATSSYRSISAGFTRSEMEFAQQIPNGKHANIDGTQIDGPAVLDSQASVEFYYARHNWHLSRKGCLETYFGAGVGYLAMDYSALVGVQKYKVADAGSGPHGVVGLRCHLSEWFSLEGSISLYGWPFSAPDITMFEDDRLLLNYTPSDAVRFFIGYRVWSYKYVQEKLTSERSAIGLKFYGPTAGLVLQF
jgi:hypothetical protein